LVRSRRRCFKLWNDPEISFLPPARRMTPQTHFLSSGGPKMRLGWSREGDVMWRKSLEKSFSAFCLSQNATWFRSRKRFFLVFSRLYDLMFCIPKSKKATLTVSRRPWIKRSTVPAN
jgi:hypothetical protein